jgi:hypothetical protein
MLFSARMHFAVIENKAIGSSKIEKDDTEPNRIVNTLIVDLKPGLETAESIRVCKRNSVALTKGAV